jgi:diguanylate cyclase
LVCREVWRAARWRVGALGVLRRQLLHSQRPRPKAESRPLVAMAGVEIAIHVWPSPAPLMSSAPAPETCTAVAPALATSAGVPDPVALAALLEAADPAAGISLQSAFDAAEQALALAQSLGDERAAALAAARLCIHRYRRGQYHDVVAHAPAALDGLAHWRFAGEQRELMRALALSANETARFDIALDTAQSLVKSAAQIDDPGPTLAASFVLAACLERLGDSWQADRVLADALAQNPGAPARERMIAMNGLAAMSLGLFHRQRGVADAAEAQALLERARARALPALALARELADPVYQVTVRGNLGEICIHLQALDEAGRLLGEALADGRARGLQAHVWRMSTSWADWLHANGRHAEALAQVHALLQEMGERAPPQTALRARESGYRAAKALQQFEVALAHFEAAEHLDRQRILSQLKAQSQLFVTRTEMDKARGDATRQLNRANQFARDAASDPLTGLGNRRHLDHRFAELLREAEQSGSALAVAMLDVDRFKPINDNFGHAAGDRVLVALAQLLRDNVRADDVLARLGGEEFVIVLPGKTRERALEICQRLCERIRHHRWPEGGPERVTASIGVTACGPFDAALLLQRCDEALYEAKRQGRDRVLGA